jgi:hypothetical protein
MTLYEFIEDFTEDDLFNADKRRIMEIAQMTIARFYFEDLYNEDMSELVSVVNANYYELAQGKLKGLKV